MFAAGSYPIDCTGDVCIHDEIVFEEKVWGGSWRKPKCIGARLIEATVLNDSYGVDKQQHTFTIRINNCTGDDPITPGTITTRKGRNIYRNGTNRKVWPDELHRNIIINEKHNRGDIARGQGTKGNWNTMYKTEFDKRGIV